MPATVASVEPRYTVGISRETAAADLILSSALAEMTCRK